MCLAHHGAKSQALLIDLAMFLHEKYHKKPFWEHQRLSMRQLRAYVKAINGTARESMQTWGFIDGAVRPVARPTREQQLYEGYHGLKYQSIVTPDGLVSNSKAKQISCN